MQKFEIEESDIFFRKIWESSADGIRIVDKDGIILDVNDSFCRIFKIGKDSLVGQNLSIIYKKEDRQKILKQYLQDLETGCIESLVTRETELWNGKTVITELANSIFYLDNYTPLLLSIFRDITDQKKAEDELLNTKLLLEQISKTSPAIITVFNPKTGKNIYENRSLLKSLGYPEETINYFSEQPLDNRFLNVHPDDVEILENFFNSIPSMKEGEPNEIIIRLKDYSGEWQWIRRISNIFQRDYNGEPALITSIFENITDRKQTEVALYKSLEFNKAVNENSPLGISVRSKNGKLLSYNKAWKKIWAMTDKEIYEDMETERTELKFDSKDEYLRDFIQNVGNIYKEGGTLYVPEIKTTNRKSRAALWLSQYFYAVKGEKETVDRVVILTEDITEKKLKDENLQKSLQEKELMLSEIHHRVKNNLQIISSLLNMQSQYITNPDILEYFRISSSRVKSMALIHENLYRAEDLSKINFEKYVRQLSTHLYNVYGADFSSVRLSLNISNIFLNIDTAIPCGLLINELLSNSLKHAFPKNKMGEIIIEMTSQKGQKYTLRVRDNGCGLPQTIDFSKLNSLGMKLVHTLVKQLDGSLEFTNYSGAEFIINFKDSNYKKRI